MTLEGVKISGKQLKVNNWAGFLLSRLQLLYAKGDCCDLTLKFPSGEELKVHKLVLNTCTNYFTENTGTDDVVTVPETLPFLPVHTIVKFMYSGLLEFKSENHGLLLSVAKTLNIPFLVKLLSSQSGEDGSKVQVKVAPKEALPTGTTDPLKKAVIMTPSPSIMSSQIPFNNMLNTKKLPIWRKKTVIRTPAPLVFEEEDPRPSRFEWPGEEEDTCTIMLATPSFNSISYESQPILKPAIVNNLPSPTSSQMFETPIKKRVMPPINHHPPESSKDDGSPSSSNQDSLKGAEEMSDDDDDGHFETIHNYDYSDDDTIQEPEPLPQPQAPKPILKPSSETPGPTPPKKVRFSFSPEEKETEPLIKEEAPKPTTSPLLPAATSSAPSPPPTSPSLPPPPPPAPTSTPPILSTPTTQIVTIPSNSLDLSDKTDNISSSHAKIIAEVLKKFPDLVKNNKNIKLKISAASSSSPLSINRNLTDKSKASYVVVKSTPLDKIGSNPVIINNSIAPTSPAENTTGPWYCKTCGDASGCELQFPTYYDFRKHLQNIHNERVDSRICEYCGYKASKRNLHLYHLYTKHNVVPPKNIKFPKCHQCNYIALSEGLLVKHQNSHQTATVVHCGICQIGFKSMESYQAHALTCKADIDTKGFYCRICKKTFKTTASRTAHAKVCQGGNADKTLFEDVEVQEDQGVEMIEVPVLGLDKSGHTLVQLPPGILLAETPNMTLLPSSESSGLNSVASGIATSIGLTVQLPDDQAVILLDSNSDFFLQGNDPVVVSNSGQMQEFIVPDMLDGDVRHLYSTTTSVPYTVSSMIPYSSVVQLQQSAPTVNSVSLAGRVEALTEPISHLEGTVQGLRRPLTHLSEAAPTIIERTTTKELIPADSQEVAEITEQTVKPFGSNVSIMVVNTSDPPPQIPEGSVEKAEPRKTVKGVDEGVLKELPQTDVKTKKKGEKEKDEPIVMEVDCEEPKEMEEEGSSVQLEGVSEAKKVQANNLMREWEMEDEEAPCEVIEDSELKPIRASLD